MKQGHDFVYHEKSNPKKISCNTFNPSKHNGGSRDRKGPMASPLFIWTIFIWTSIREICDFRSKLNMGQKN